MALAGGKAMTIAVYEMQAVSMQMCTEAKEAITAPRVPPKLEAIACLVGARLCSLAACAKATADVFLLSLKRVIKIIVIPFAERLSCNSFVRMAIATALCVAVMALRFFSSLAGVVSPELTYGVLRVHRFLLFLGLLYRAQFPIIGILPPPLDMLTSRINELRWRTNIVDRVLRRIDSVEARHGTISTLTFYNDIWAPEEGQALADELALVVEEFNRAVQVPHPILEVFQAKLTSNIHREALAVCHAGLYTQDEVEDMTTAFLAVLYRATYRTVCETFQLCERELTLREPQLTEVIVNVGGDKRVRIREVLLDDGTPCCVKEELLPGGHVMRMETAVAPIGESRTIEHRMLRAGEKVCVDDIVVADGHAIEGVSAGGLEAWKQHCIELLLLVRGMSPATSDALLCHLCSDEGRMRTARPDLVPLALDPVINRCFKLIVEFYTAFVAHHLSSDTRALQAAFTI